MPVAAAVGSNFARTSTVARATASAVPPNICPSQRIVAGLCSCLTIDSADRCANCGQSRRMAFGMRS
jgi:hypothetical protein